MDTNGPNDHWENSSFQVFAQIADNTDFKTVDKNIADSKFIRDIPEDKHYKTKLFLAPMKDWHLRMQWENGIQTGGLIEYVRLFSYHRHFCITARLYQFYEPEHRADLKKEPGKWVSRKAIGSLRKNLVSQFYTESLLVVLFSFGLSLLLAKLFLPWFNHMASKEMFIPWANAWFWIFCLGFVSFTTAVAGSYPALYLSSFEPVKVLKGAFRTGRLAAVPRKVLVVLQFTISIALIIGTVVVYNQIQYTRNRPIGYDRNGLMMIRMKSPDYYGKFDLLKTEMENAGAITNLAESSRPVTDVYSNNDGYQLAGKRSNGEWRIRLISG